MGRLFESHLDNKDPDGLDTHKPGAKLDAGKPRMSLVLQNFRRALALVGWVGTYGANKYSDNGWAFVNNGVERYSDALFRHLLEEEYALQPDPESKIPHAAHAAWNALARLELMLRQESEADSEVWKAPHNVKKCREMNEQSEMHEETLLATTKKQRAAKVLRNIVNITGVVLDDEHEAMLSNCEAGTAGIGDLHEVWKSSEVSSLSDFWDRLKVIVNHKTLTQLEADRLFDRAVDRAIERNVFATSKEAALYKAGKVCEEIEAKRRMDAAIADKEKLIAREEAIQEENAKLLQEIAAEEGELTRLAPTGQIIREGWSIPGDMKGRSLTEREIDGIAEREMQRKRIVKEREKRAEDEKSEDLETWKEICDKARQGLWFDDEEVSSSGASEEKLIAKAEEAKAREESYAERVRVVRAIREVLAETESEAMQEDGQDEPDDDADEEAMKVTNALMAPSIEVHMRPMSIEESEKLDAELKARGMRRAPEAEAERVERLRLRELFAPMKPALMERIQLGEGLPESMKGRKFTEEELSDLAELRINEMVSDQMKEKKELIRLIREGWSIPDDMKGRSLTEEEIDGIAEKEMQYRRILLDLQLAERLRQRKEKEAAGFVGQQQEWFNEDDEDYDDY